MPQRYKVTFSLVNRKDGKKGKDGQVLMQYQAQVRNPEFGRRTWVCIPDSQSKLQPSPGHETWWVTEAAFVTDDGFLRAVTLVEEVQPKVWHAAPPSPRALRRRERKTALQQQPAQESAA
jgi:hypothetical protein